MVRGQIVATTRPRLQVLQVYRARGLTDPVFETQFDALRKRVDIFRCPIQGSGIWAYGRGIRSLRRMAAAQKIDLIHAHYGLTGIVAFLACGGSKLVVSFMGTDLIGGVDARGRRTAAGILLAGLSRLLGRWGVAAAIVKSKEMRRLFPRRCRIFTIPNGVDLSNFTPMDQSLARREIGLKPQGRYVLFAADPARVEKNFALAQEAVHRLSDPTIELIAVHGQPHDRMRLFFNAVNAILLTSWHEGSPNVIKEALACHCPIVSTDVGDVRELVGDVEGCTVAAHKADLLADGIRLALQHGRVQPSDALFARELGATATALVAVYNAVVGYS